MENTIKQKKALVMSEEQWEQNKKWLLQFPGAFCLPVIQQFERYLFPLPFPPFDPSSLVSEKDKIGLEPNESCDQENQK